MSCFKTNETSPCLADTQDKYLEMFEDMWPKALEEVKRISEASKAKAMKINVRPFIPRPVEVVWKAFTQPEHITKWNKASDDWRCPEAVNDLREGGAFDYLMASKDDKVSFYFKARHGDVSFVSFKITGVFLILFFLSFELKTV